MVSCLLHAENILHVAKPYCLFHFTVLGARVRMGYVCSSFMRKSIIALCCICFLFVMHLMDRMDVIVHA